MPKITRCHKYGKQGYQYGNGICHLYKPGTENSRVRALEKAIKDRDEAEKNKKFSLGNLIQTFLSENL